MNAQEHGDLAGLRSLIGVEDFEYVSLENDRQIRLLQVLGQENGVMICSIEAHSLDDVPQYCALSYVWGNAADPDNHREILLNGRRFKTTANPVEFMHSQLSHQNPSLPIWIDQICINQKDNEERGKQVALMGSIYIKATKVIAWLGSETRYGAIHPFSSIRAIMLAWSEYLYGPSPDMNINIGRLQPRHPRVFEFVETLQTEHAWPKWEAHIKAFTNLLGHEHFSRLWTLQEIVLNQNAMYRLGQDELPDLALHVACSVFTSAQWSPFFSMIQASSSAKLARLNHVTLSFQEPLKYQFQFTPQEIDLATCYLIGIQRRATDPRDYVYGCLGMAHDVQPGDLIPLYGGPIVDTYRQFALFYLQKHYLQTLYYLAPRTQNHRHYPRYLQEIGDPDVIIDSAGSWPSWIPMPHTSFDPYFSHLRDQDGSSEVIYNKANDSISIKGVIVGTIGSIAPALKPVQDLDAPHDLNMAQWLLNAEMAAKNIKTPYFNGQTSSEVVWRTAIYDVGESMEQCPAPLELGDCFAQWKRYQESLLKGYNPALSSPVVQQVQRYARLLYDKGHFTGTQRFALLEDGHLALVYHGVEEGDRVCVFQGRNTPFAIRPQNEGYLVLGPVYVHGMMNGELMTGDHVPNYVDLVLL